MFLDKEAEKYAGVEDMKDRGSPSEWRTGQWKEWGPHLVRAMGI